MSDERERVAKVAGLLFSDNDGEALAAARALRRIVDVHRFKEMLLEVVVDKSTMLAFMASQILELDLQDHERRFVQAMQASALANPEFKMTPKQAAWFARLFEDVEDE